MKSLGGVNNFKKRMKGIASGNSSYIKELCITQLPFADDYEFFKRFCQGTGDTKYEERVCTAATVIVGCGRTFMLLAGALVG